MLAKKIEQNKFQRSCVIRTTYRKLINQHIMYPDQHGQISKFSSLSNDLRFFSFHTHLLDNDDDDRDVWK